MSAPTSTSLEQAEKLLYLLPKEPGDQYPYDAATRLANEAIVHLRPAVAAALQSKDERIAELESEIERLKARFIPRRCDFFGREQTLPCMAGCHCENARIAALTQETASA